MRKLIIGMILISVIFISGCLREYTYGINENSEYNETNDETYDFNWSGSIFGPNEGYVRPGECIKGTDYYTVNRNGEYLLECMKLSDIKEGVAIIDAGEKELYIKIGEKYLEGTHTSITLKSIAKDKISVKGNFYVEWVWSVEDMEGWDFYDYG